MRTERAATTRMPWQQKLREAWACPKCRYYRRGALVLALLYLASTWFAG